MLIKRVLFRQDYDRNKTIRNFLTKGSVPADMKGHFAMLQNFKVSNKGVFRQFIQHEKRYRTAVENDKLFDLRLRFLIKHFDRNPVINPRRFPVRPTDWHLRSIGLCLDTLFLCACHDNRHHPHARSKVRATNPCRQSSS